MKWHLEAENISTFALTACGRPGLMATPGPLELLLPSVFHFLPQQAQCAGCLQSKQARLWPMQMSATPGMIAAVETGLHLLAAEMQMWK